VRNAVRSVQPPKYVRAGRGSIVDAVEPRVRDLLKRWPDIVLAENLVHAGQAACPYLWRTPATLVLMKI
jgi:hypothetical protein